MSGHQPSGVPGGTRKLGSIDRSALPLGLMQSESIIHHHRLPIPVFSTTFCRSSLLQRDYKIHSTIRHHATIRFGGDDDDDGARFRGSVAAPGPTAITIHRSSSVSANTSSITTIIGDCWWTFRPLDSRRCFWQASLGTFLAAEESELPIGIGMQRRRGGGRRRRRRGIGR
jgi:hypothetical protein